MRPLLVLIAFFFLSSCSFITRNSAVNPCHELSNANETNTSIHKGKDLLYSCLQEDSIESDDLAKYIRNEYQNNKKVISEISDCRGSTLEFASDWTSCVMNELLSKKEDIIYFVQYGHEQFFNSRKDKKMEAYCKCDIQLANANAKYKEFYDKTGSYSCDQI